MASITDRLGRMPGAGLLLGLIVFYGLIGGDAVNGLVIDEASPLVAAVMAGVFGTIPLVLLAERSALLRRGRRRLLWELNAGTLINRMAVSNTFVIPLTLLSLQRLEALGTVIALLWVGPLSVAIWKMVTGSPRRLSSLLWLPLATPGMLLLTRPWEGNADLWGVLLALGAAACYANFLLTYDRLGEALGDRVNMAIAESMVRSTAALAALSAIVITTLAAFGQTVPGITPGPDWLTWRVIGFTFLSGLLTGFVAQIGQNLIFGQRLLSAATFSVLTAIEPSVALTLDWWVLGHQPTGLDWLGTLLVTVAGAGCFYQLEVRGKSRAELAT
ncbi:EamA family transporter [Actinomadura citrea]|uniref:EamA family transporter n=1 Tax=Actinomadura citrea TaxID=46158 RepID=UPI002E2B6DB6|nr:EamA family transporter [Actinomadura citrea]